jgi:hypothetical protein
MKRTGFLTILLAMVFATRANAVIITGRAARAQTEPSTKAALKDSGWQYQGDWLAFFGYADRGELFYYRGARGGAHRLHVQLQRRQLPHRCVL